MLVNDPIADMLTRIRNALIARHDTVTMPASNMKKAIAAILLDEGYVKSVDYIDDGLQGQIKIVLKYAQGKESVIKGLKAHLQAGTARVRQERRDPQGSRRAGRCHRLHVQGRDERQKRPRCRHRRRSAGLCVVMEVQ